MKIRILYILLIMIELSLIGDLNMGEWGWNFRIHEMKAVEDPSDSRGGSSENSVQYNAPAPHSLVTQIGWLLVCLF